MADRTPTRVVLYARASGGPKAAAEFRLTGGRVTLHVLDEQWAGVARQYQERGVPSDSQRRAVPVKEAGAFMRALVEPRRSSYFEWVDESDRPAD
jgi:hypothetical protein